MGQDACCAAVRRFLSKRVGERLSIDERPDLVHRAPAVEEVWRSASHGYVVEHTRIEAFEAQIQDDVAFQRLVGPLEERFADKAPGRFAAAIPLGAASRSRGGFDEAARNEIERLIAARLGALSDGETAILRSDRLPYELRLHKRPHRNHARRGVLFRRWIEGENLDDVRSQRIGRALDRKLPKLLAAAESYALASVLILESNDIALSNVFEVAQSFALAIKGRGDLPDLVFLVESDSLPFYGWLLKDGDAMLPNGNYFQDYGSALDED